MNLQSYIRTIPDFPKKGILFRDVTTLFNNAEAFSHMVDVFAKYWTNKSITAIAGIDARGFIIGGAVAYKMKLPFVALRKKGKLPFDTISKEFDLEYGTATLEVHKDAVKTGDHVLIVDDLIATGGTALAGINLIEAIDAKVAGCAFLVDLPDLSGSSKIRDLGIESHALITFDGH